MLDGARATEILLARVNVNEVAEKVLGHRDYPAVNWKRLFLVFRNCSLGTWFPVATNLRSDLAVRDVVFP